MRVCAFFFFAPLSSFLSRALLYVGCLCGFGMAAVHDSCDSLSILQLNFLLFRSFASNYIHTQKKKEEVGV